MKNIIGIHGRIGSGKSTLTNMLVQLLNEDGVLSEERYFAAPLKQIAEILFGIGGYTQEEKNVYLPEWGMTVGEALQKIGTEVMRNNFDENVWVKAAMKQLHSDYVYIFSDVRFPNEADAIKERGGILIKLKGDPAKVRKNTSRDVKHASETALDNYEGWDLVFDNSGTILKLKEFALKIEQLISVPTSISAMNEK